MIANNYWARWGGAWFLIMLLVGIPAISKGRAQQQPVAYPNSTVRFGRARFTVLSNRLLRMEMALHTVHNGTINYTFDDRATSVVIHRVMMILHDKQLSQCACVGLAPCSLLLLLLFVCLFVCLCVCFFCFFAWTGPPVCAVQSIAPQCFEHQHHHRRPTTDIRRTTPTIPTPKTFEVSCSLCFLAFCYWHFVFYFILFHFILFYFILFYFHPWVPFPKLEGAIIGTCVCVCVRARCVVLLQSLVTP